MSDFYTPDSNNLFDLSNLSNSVASGNPSLEPTQGIFPHLDAN